MSCIKIYDNICNVEEIINEINNVLKNYDYYKKEDNWMSLPLITINGKNNISSNILQNKNNKIFCNTEILEKCPYIKSILNKISKNIYLTRILKLNAHSLISEHIDDDFEDGIKNNYIRCHIPIITNENVYFYIDDEKYHLTTGSLWYTDVSKKTQSNK